MKLELKQIAGYLPYGLKVYTDGYSDTKIITLNGYDTYEDLGMINISSTEKHGGQNLSEVKPILRPLSDLTKEIEVNGEKFVPISELLKMKYPMQDEEGKYSNINVSQGGNPFACFTYQANRDIEIYEKNIENTPYWVIQKLYEWHFDIHGLIEKGLAIDKNTL